jgi:hypothetical protein
MSSLDFDQRVIVKDTDRTCASGTAGRHGRVVGKSYEDDDLQRSVLAYAVAMDENGEKVWMVDTEDLEADET